MELGERLEMGAETMADRIALLSALSELEDSGLVDEREAPGGVDERGSPGGTVYALTSRGRERATALYADVEDRMIEVRNGTGEEVSLGAVDRYLPVPAVVRALARLTDDGSRSGKGRRRRSRPSSRRGRSPPRSTTSRRNCSRGRTWSTACWRPTAPTRRPLMRTGSASNSTGDRTRSGRRPSSSRSRSRRSRPVVPWDGPPARTATTGRRSPSSSPAWRPPASTATATARPGSCSRSPLPTATGATPGGPRRRSRRRSRPPPTWGRSAGTSGTATGRRSTIRDAGERTVQGPSTHQPRVTNEH